MVPLASIRPEICSDAVTVAGDIRKAARLEFVLERREFGLGALHDGVGATDRIREGFVAEIVKAGNGGIFDGSHDRTLRVRLRLGPVRKFPLPIGLFFC
jgi:hypothetical protein